MLPLEMVKTQQFLDKYPMGMSAEYYLGVDITLISLQSLSIFGNGFIICLFFISKRLKKNMGLRLILLLCMSDFIFAVTALPYIINYLIGWNLDYFDYSPLFIIVSSIPLLVQFKINLIITIAIAVDRLQAMRFPVFYRGKNHMRYVWGILIIGLILGYSDVILEFFTTEFNIHRYNCAAIGCFQDKLFRAYWGISNMVLNVIALILTIWVAIELNLIGSRSLTQIVGQRERKQLAQANKLSFGVLLISMAFLLIPSTFVGIIELYNLDIFKKYGPFYVFGLLLAGVSNSFIYIGLHQEIRTAAIYVLKNRTFKMNVPTSSIAYATNFRSSVSVHPGGNEFRSSY
uniref:G-protein coupled receptors family 1 profile domain-containing protein n=1 Tax=Panagrolaimus davidi TaxID=227884 RepID=A0A914P9W3_9BILA